ncbi:MAG: hypothetical protein ACJ8J7_07475, partial [Sulfurifustaceae bacterium]
MDQRSRTAAWKCGQALAAVDRRIDYLNAHGTSTPLG